MEIVIRLNEKDVLARPELLDAIKGVAGHSAVPKTAAEQVAPASVPEKAVTESPVEKASPTAELPDKETTIKEEDVRAALTYVRDTFGPPRAKAILQKHGANSLPQLDASLYAVVLAEAKAVR